MVNGNIKVLRTSTSCAGPFTEGAKKERRPGATGNSHTTAAARFRFATPKFSFASLRKTSGVLPHVGVNICYNPNKVEEFIIAPLRQNMKIKE